MFSSKHVLGAMLLVAAAGAWAQPVKVDGAWARATVPGQKATGAFMTLTAPQGATLVGASSPAAGVTEIHEMAMQGDVMTMRAIAALPLPAGQAVALKPGGYHVMLMDLKAPLASDATVPLTLLFRNAQGEQTRTELQLPVRAATAPAPAHGHSHKH